MSCLKSGSRSRDKPLLRVEVSPATVEQEPILANLLTSYALDFSPFFAVEFGPDGSFVYPHLALYWREPGRHPFLIRIEGEVAGFALIRRGSIVSGNQLVWDMAEFSISRPYRRRGAGTAASHQVWSRFAGPWEVRVIEQNRLALSFWEHAIAQFTGEPAHPLSTEVEGKLWNVFSFTSVHDSGIAD